MSRESKVKTLADGFESRQDNFLLLRFLAASLVIYGHGGAVTGGKGLWDLFLISGWGVYSGTIAVMIFFAISGYMITGSYLRREHLPNYLWARVLRIFPAYLFCLVLSAYLLGTIYTTLPVLHYLSRHAVFHYVTQNLKLQTTMDWSLPGVFAGNPKTNTINGAIWTLPGEFRMYLWVALVGALGVLSRRWLCSIVIAVIFAVAVIYPSRDVLFIPTVYLQLAGMFGLGVLAYLHRRFIPVGWPYAATAALIAYFLHATPLGPFAFAVALTAFTFAFAYCTGWYGYNRFGDYSYGLYLWGFPAQQVVAHHCPRLSPIWNSATAFPLALGMAILSWHLVERPALALKNRPKRWWAECRRRGHTLWKNLLGLRRAKKTNQGQPEPPGKAGVTPRL
ncbi:MAG: acyltransferase family protein [Chthoniobacterales bacterium]